MDRHTRKELEKERLRQAAKESQQLRAEQLIPKNLSREELIKAAKEIDDNRSAKYVRKKPTIEQKQKKQADEIIEAYNQIDKLIEPVEVPTVEETTDEWDVKIGDVITYFDPELSYEITGYRPLTKDKGLDFDPTPFCEVGRKYVETGSYTDYLKGTVLWRQFWEREKSRCKNGLTIGKYRITGDNYFWLNYYRLLSVLNVKNVQGRDESFPTFINKQYEYFHYIELARVLKKDVCALKSRGVGASEIACSIGSNLYTTTKQSRSVYTAKTEVLLQPTLEKTWQELDFLNGETQGGFKHLRMKKDTDMMKKASKVERGTNREYGHMAIIEGIVSDKPRKLRGRRVENLIFEEAGSFQNLIETYIQSEPLVSLLGRRIGTRYVFGTGGESGPGLAGLSKIFYNPEVFNVLPYKNNYTQDGQVVFTAFFIPAYTMWFGVDNIPGYDHRGVVDEEAAKKYYIDQRKRMSTDPEALIKYKAEYCFTPDEALILEGENRFDQEKLVEQLANIELHKIVEKPKPASLIWPMKEGHVDREARPTIDFNDKGKIMIAELPITDDNGLAYNNLYCAGVDSIDSDSSTSTGQEDVSSFCIVVYRRQFGTMAPRPVAIYKDRPRDVRVAYDNALKLCQFYNCKALLEATRVSLKTYWQGFNKLNYLRHRPKATANTTTKTNLKQYGVPATQTIIDHQLDLISDYINDYCDQICYSELINELIRYSYANKRKFDIVAAFAMALLSDEDMHGLVPKQRNQEQINEMAELRYYKNEYGQVQFGSAPKNDNYGFFRTESQMPIRGYLSLSF